MFSEIAETSARNTVQRKAFTTIRKMIEKVVVSGELSSRDGSAFLVKGEFPVEFESGSWQRLDFHITRGGQQEPAQYYSLFYWIGCIEPHEIRTVVSEKLRTYPGLSFQTAPFYHGA